MGMPTEQVYHFLKPQNTMGQFLDVDRANSILHNFFKNEKIEYLDLLPLFRRYANQETRKWLSPNEDFYYKNDSHLNIKGNNLMGLLVAQYLLGKRLLDLPDRGKKFRTIEDRLKSFS